MKILKGNKTRQPFNPNKILKRVKDQSKNLNVDPTIVAQKVIAGVMNDMETKDIDALIATTAVNLILEDPDYSYLASRILITRHAKIIGVEPVETDFLFDYKGFKSYLYKYSKRDDMGFPIELPHMSYKRVTKALKMDTEYYNALCNHEISMATPIFVNAGRDSGAMISCNLTTLVEDSSEGILKTLDDVSQSSRDGAGIGLHIHSLRSKHSLVSSFKGKAGGVVRFLDMVQSHMRFFKQGNRSGSAAAYLGVWHRDVEEFLELRLHAGEQRMRTPDLFTAICLPDLFWEKYINDDEDWYLFCPHEVQKAGFENLYKFHGADFTEHYNKLVDAGLGFKVKTSDILYKIQKSMAEAGLPYVMNWCNANKNHPQSHLGTCTGSNLCIEIYQMSRPNYTAQCALSSIPLHNLDLNDFEELGRRAKVITRALNSVIENNNWSTEGAANAGKEQRAIAIGIAGLADYMAKHKLDFTGVEAQKFNRKMIETIYNSSLEESCRLGNEGIYKPVFPKVHKDGRVNSTFVALMPTASSATLVGCYESFEPVQANIFQRRIDAGEFTIVNKYMIKELQDRDMWNIDIRNQILANNGSVQSLNIDEDFKQRYKTIWEHSQKSLINLAGIRQEFVDQGQSMNLYFQDATTGKIGAALKYGWNLGLPTGSYYTKTQSKIDAPVSLVQTKSEVSPGWEISCYGCEA